MQHLYGPVQPVNYNTEQLAAFRGGNTSDVVLNKNQHFIVWMRPAAQPTFRKLWAVINEALLAGDSLPPSSVLVTPLGCCIRTLEWCRPACCLVVMDMCPLTHQHGMLKLWQVEPSASQQS